MIGVASILDKAGCTDEYKPGITIYKFGEKIQVNGPEQIEALTQQVPEISAQFTLWGQAGSNINLGRMVVLPMKNTVLYVQPVYISSAKNQIPELVRVIVTIGTQTVMDKTVEAAFAKIKQKYLKIYGNVPSGLSPINDSPA